MYLCVSCAPADMSDVTPQAWKSMQCSNPWSQKNSCGLSDSPSAEETQAHAYCLSSFAGHPAGARPGRGVAWLFVTNNAGTCSS